MNTVGTASCRAICSKYYIMYTVTNFLFKIMRFTKSSTKQVGALEMTNGVEIIMTARQGI